MGTLHQFNCDQQHGESWERRARRAVQLLDEVARDLPRRPLRLADFGCGNQRLSILLAKAYPGQYEYQGYDLLAQVPETIVMDLQEQLPVGEYDAVFCLGLLEYLRDLPAFVIRLRAVSRYAIASYVTSDAGAYSESAVRQKGWVTHHSSAELEALFQRAGFEKRSHVVLDRRGAGLWLWRRGEDQPAA